MKYKVRIGIGGSSTDSEPMPIQLAAAMVVMFKYNFPHLTASIYSYIE